MSKLTFGSLFAGIGGFDLGLERSGMVCKWQVEIDPFCQRVLAKHWPDVRRYSDVREAGKHNLETVDVTVGGIPCQPHGVGGKRRGADDDRDLWPEYFRIACEMRPTWLVLENVPGIRTTILDQVLSDLESIDYATTTLDIPACAFNAPHARHRYFIVANTMLSGRQIVLREHVKHSAQKSNYRRWETSNPLGALWQYLTQLEKGLGQPCILGNDDGLPYRVDRLGALGNAVVPQVAEWIGRQIIKAHSATAE